MSQAPVAAAAATPAAAAKSAATKSPEAKPVEVKPKVKGRGKSKLLIIVGASVLLLGVGAYFVLAGSEKKPTPAEAKKHKEVVKAPSIYVPLDPPFVVNFDAGSGARFLQVAVQLMTRAPEMAELLKAHDPAIRNDLLLLLGNQKVEEVASREGKERLREAALEAVRKIISDEGGRPEQLEALYFTSFVMQ